MAYNNGFGDRMDDLRFRNPQSPRDESYSGYNSPRRVNGGYMATHSQSSNDTRANLQRRFTTDSSKMPTLTPIGQQPGQVVEPIDLSATTFHKVQLLEKKRREYEQLREQRRRFEAEMKLFDLQQEREKQELEQMAEDLNRVHMNTGHQSEPTTPPEYRDYVFPSVLSRPNRFSASSITSPLGLINRGGRSGSQLASPPSGLVQTPQDHVATNKLPSKSVPGSRRGSNEKDKVYMPELTMTNHRAVPNRYSMPVAGLATRNHNGMPDLASVLGLGQINTTGFLFGDDDEKSQVRKDQNLTTSPDVKSYLQMNATDDKFPILVRRDEYPGLLSASSAALDLALSQSPGPESEVIGWPSVARHRPFQHSLPLNTFSMQQHTSLNNVSPSSERQTDVSTNESPNNIRQLHRHSMEATFSPFGENPLIQSATTSAGAAQTRPALANLQSSYSTNDLPTMKSSNGLASVITPPKTHAQQHFHNHNASLGRIPPHAVNNRHSRELSGGDSRVAEQGNHFQSMQSGLQGNAAPFGPPLTTAGSSGSTPMAVTPPGMSPFAAPAYYGGYGVQMMNMGMTPIHMGNPMQMNNQLQAYQPQNMFANYQNYGNVGRFPDSQARVIQQRRVQNGEETARFANVQLEHLQGEIYGLCKDQHGCRYLQKKLEERNPEHVQIIFLETNQHVVELMTDPFGNYLCQKLLEYSNDEQRTVLINNAASQMVKIALNQHGTRALQKMIEFISTREQIETIIHALRDRVVELIQDLNGNHVIQKCLNRLSADDAQFIFDAVGINCVVVGTHRHGCCVLQRCIDHASGNQKAQLISQVTANAYALVQDPFGNYVVQYILDLAEPAFTDPLCHSFSGNIPALSKQKFSSNVIEKCLRTADTNVKRVMIDEMLHTNELEKMLRDSFANYVVQTAMDYADAETKARIIEAIRPILPAIRQTPYGRRIQGKIMGTDGQGRLSGASSGQITPNDISSPGQIPVARQLPQYPVQSQNNFSNMNGVYSSPPNNAFQPSVNVSAGNMISPAPTGHASNSDRLSSASSTFSQFSNATSQSSVQQQFPSYGRVPQAGNFNYF
ncbi:MAG: hypothetical protein M1830_001186 [Pleopsidium flavum]|nr:MAG: hypothetical protein M1830_001186 [Pleopsidium flavum]